MLRTALVLAFAAALIPAGCGGDGDEFAGELAVPLSAQSDSGQDGEAMLSEMDSDTTRVVVEVGNAPGNPQPAHIHRGSCQNLDPTPAYALKDVVDGKSTSEINVPIEDLVGHGFAVNVHKSAAEADVYVACGDIEEITQASGR